MNLSTDLIPIPNTLHLDLLLTLQDLPPPGILLHLNQAPKGALRIAPPNLTGKKATII